MFQEGTESEEKIMMELICAIPDELGWILVGLALSAVISESIKLGKVLVEMWKEYHKNEEEGEE